MGADRLTAGIENIWTIMVKNSSSEKVLEVTCSCQQAKGGSAEKSVRKISNNSNTWPLLTKAFAFEMRCLWIVVVSLNNIY